MIRKTSFVLSHILLLLAMLCLLTAHYSLGQSPGYRNYTVKDGLPSSEVYNCMQDSKGFMWFSTDRGVCRFDGYEFKTFTTSNGLADNTIFECKEDFKGRIWFRSLSGRLSYFYNDSIYRLPINDSLTKLVKAAFFESMVIDSTDNLYLGFYNFPGGIIKINLKNNRLSIIKIQTGIPYIFIASNGQVLTGQTQFYDLKVKLDSNRSHSSSLFLYSIQKGDSTVRLVNKWEWDIPQKMLIHDCAINLKNGKIAAIVNSDFFISDTSSSKFTFFKRFPGEIININEDKESNIWLCTQNIPKYYSNQGFVSHQLPPYIIKSHITSIATDKEGGTWFTSLYGGVYYTGSLYYKNYNIDNGLTGNKITAVAAAKNGTIWVASERINKIAEINSDSIRYHFLPDLEGLSISDILLRGNKEIWLATTRGMFIYSENKAFTPIASTRGIIGYYNLIPDSDESCWTSSYSILYMLKKTGRVIEPIKSKAFNSKIFAMDKCSDKSILISTLSGLWSYKNDTLVSLWNKFHLLRNRIEGIIKTTTGEMWMATKDTGVIVLKDDKLIHITAKDRLLSNFCKCICVDHKGNIWVGTNKGLSHILLKNINNTSVVDTIVNLNSANLIDANKLLSQNDTIYAATSNGLTLFDMNKASYNKVAPPVYITSLKINNKNWPLNLTSGLTYDENYFFISFVGLTYQDAGNVQYRYKMIGIDTGWIYTKNRDVQYPKLPPGNYTFIVSAANNDGKWNQNPASLQFKISPPFWATWWFRSLIIMGIAGFIYWRFKVIEYRAKKQADINKQLITMELKELKAQMDPHFLFNNLNTLTHLVELKSDDAPEFVEELSKYYRYSLQFRNAEFTALENELKQAERYLHILRIRFGNNMHIKWNIQESLTSHYIATYSLQLLLENITKHNIVSSEKPLWVEIVTTEQNSLIIRNQLQLKNSSALSNGHGLKSINQRYQLLTKRKPIISQTSQYFSVELPLITPEEYEGIYS